MKKITTESGTVYFWDPDERRLQRTTNVRPLIWLDEPAIVAGEQVKYQAALNPVDGEWRLVRNGMVPSVGNSIHAVFDNGDWIVSTPVVSIEEMHDGSAH